MFSLLAFLSVDYAELIPWQCFLVVFLFVQLNGFKGS